MKVARQTIVQLLREQEHDADAERAQRELPDEIDTHDDAHLDLVEALGIDPLELVGRLTRSSDAI